MLTATSGTGTGFEEGEREKERDGEMRGFLVVVFVGALFFSLSGAESGWKKDARTSEVRHRVQKLDDLLPHERGTRVDPGCGPADLGVAEAPWCVDEFFFSFFFSRQTEEGEQGLSNFFVSFFLSTSNHSVLTLFEAPVVVEHGETVGDEQGRLCRFFIVLLFIGTRSRSRSSFFVYDAIDGTIDAFNFRLVI